MGVEHNMYVFKWQVIGYWVVWMDCVTDEEWLFYISILELGKRIFWKMCFTWHSLDQSSRKLCNGSVLFIYLSSNIHSIGQPSEKGQHCVLKTNQNQQLFTARFWNDKLCSHDAGQTSNTLFPPLSVQHVGYGVGGAWPLPKYGLPGASPGGWGPQLCPEVGVLELVLSSVGQPWPLLTDTTPATLRCQHWEWTCDTTASSHFVSQ